MSVYEYIPMRFLSGSFPSACKIQLFFFITLLFQLLHLVLSFDSTFKRITFTMLTFLVDFQLQGSELVDVYGSWVSVMVVLIFLKPRI